MDQDIFVKHVQDVCRLCEKYNSPRFSKFLDERGQREILKAPVANTMLYGGYDDAEWKMFGAFPEYETAQGSAFPIKVLDIHKKYNVPIGHRDYLGTILSLGIDRNKIGDILVRDSGAYVYVSEDISEFLASNLTKIASCGVRVELIDMDAVVVPEKRSVIMDVVAASRRIDAVVAAVTHKSRRDMKKEIALGNVKVNHEPVSGRDDQLKENDLLSIKGYGRIRIVSFGGTTRSGRLHIDVERFL
ncbi:MAG: hypothetical protein E7417_02010 [Ruminococcaceae bacterium]|nr:hypothetical protein [Oscillospiraceae bacterium]